MAARARGHGSGGILPRERPGFAGIESAPVPALSKGGRHIGRVELDIPGDAPTSLMGARWSIVYYLEVRVGESPANRRTHLVEMGQPMKGLSANARLSLPDW